MVRLEVNRDRLTGQVSDQNESSLLCILKVQTENRSGLVQTKQSLTVKLLGNENLRPGFPFGVLVLF